MRVAILVPGLPRFCREFDLFIEALEPGHDYDWYFYLWQGTPQTDQEREQERAQGGGDAHTQKFNLIHPRFYNWQPEDLEPYIAQRLPPKHRIQALAQGDHRAVVMPNFGSNRAQEISIMNTVKNWTSLKRCWNLLAGTGRDYDLVIRARTDIALNAPLDLLSASRQVKQNFNTVFISNNNQCGHGVLINDWYALTSLQNMSHYVCVIDRCEDYVQRGVIFHPETMLAYHLAQGGLRWQSGPVGLRLRELGTWQGEPYQPGSVYTSDWGRWH